MKSHWQVFLGMVAGGGLSLVAVAQTYVTPKMGGGQTAADMVHIDIFYDAEANQLHAHVDDTYGVPELRALAPGEAFDPQARYAVLNDKAYNAQYGWNAGGLFAFPAGTAIWIEVQDASPGLETYESWGRLGSYAPLFGTAGTPVRWKWSGVMVHNTYAIRHSPTDRLFAEYHIYFGDAATGERGGFMHLDDAFVRLEWTTVPMQDPLTCLFGADNLTAGTPLRFLNADQLNATSESVVNLRYTNAGPCALQFAGAIPMLAVAATAANGGPADQHAALGACVELQIESLTGPAGGRLSIWELEESQPRLAVPVGSGPGLGHLPVSTNLGAPGSDPFGRRAGRHFAVNQPGLYGLHFRLVDTSTNGPGGGPLHAPSEIYCFLLQAGATIASITKQDASLVIAFGGQPGGDFWLEESAALGPSAEWSTVAGPVPGTNRIQRLSCGATPALRRFLRLRVQQP